MIRIAGEEERPPYAREHTRRIAAGPEAYAARADPGWQILGRNKTDSSTLKLSRGKIQAAVSTARGHAWKE